VHRNVCNLSKRGVKEEDSPKRLTGEEVTSHRVRRRNQRTTAWRNHRVQGVIAMG
jgi:hypothetical protein